jgi:hypothetical protein
MRLPVCILKSAFGVATVLAATQLFAQMPAGVNESLTNLADQPATRTAFVLDRSMLQAARGVLQSEGMKADSAAAALTSISFDNYRYAHPAIYTPEAMTAIIDAYHSAGWKHLVDERDVRSDGTERPVVTDLWLHFTGSDIDGVTVLARGVRNVNLIQVACDLRPLDLLRLSGHFGIPKVDPGAVMVPDPKDR